MEILFVIAVSILLFGMVSRRIESSIVTAPMVFVFLGMVAGEWGVGLVSKDVVELEGVRLLAEVTLILILFTDASRIRLHDLRRDHNLPVRLLALGLPLTIVLGTLAASVLLESLSVLQAALLAAILAPTDAALSQSVVNSPRLPVRIRQTLNVESGLNDGIALPIVLVLLGLAGGDGDDRTTAGWVAL